MSKCRIYLSGAHSTGKTTILNDLKSHLNICFEEEIARKVIRQFMWERDEFMPDTNPKNFLKLNEEILRQQIQIDERYRRASEGFIVDRCIDPLIYIERYIGVEAKQNLDHIPDLTAWTESLKTALIFVVKPHKECIQDDSVRMPPRLEDIEEFHTTLMNEYQELNIPVYEIVELDRETRKTFILEKIRTTFPNV